MKIRRLGTMLDCSRNAVMSVQSVKKWIALVADMGYNTVLLYTEDTYEVDNQPYFGYLRGRYSQKELREIDDYAVERGIEIIPCIQTLAHLKTLFHWPIYEDIMGNGYEFWKGALQYNNWGSIVTANTLCQKL